MLKQKYGCFNETFNLYLPSKKLCAIGDKNLKNPNVLITGDSHAMADVGMFNVLLKNAKLKGYVFTQFQLAYDRDHSAYWNKIIALVRSRHYKYIVFARWWVMYADSANNKSSGYDDIKNQLNRVLKISKAYHVTPVIVFDFPPLLSVSKACGFSKITQKHCYNPVGSIEHRELAINKILASLKNKLNLLILQKLFVISDFVIPLLKTSRFTQMRMTTATSAFLDQSGLGHYG